MEPEVGSKTGPFQLSVGGMLLLVAVCGILMGAFRLHFSLGSFVAGVLALVVLRVRDVRMKYVLLGKTLSQAQLVELIVTSTGVAIGIMLGSLVAFFMPFLLSVLVNDVWPLLLSPLLSICACTFLRRILWPHPLESEFAVESRTAEGTPSPDPASPQPPRRGPHDVDPQREIRDRVADRARRDALRPVQQPGPGKSREQAG